VALTPTQGLGRGSEIIDTGETLQVPVGKSLLGRVFNVFEEPIDRKGDMKEVFNGDITDSFQRCLASLLVPCPALFAYCTHNVRAGPPGSPS